MQLTKSQQNLVNDAIEAGYEVAIEATKVTLKKGKKGLAMFQDGTAYRLDVTNGITIRTQKVMRQVLGV